MRVGLLHLGQSVDFVVSITFLRSPVLAILAIGRVVLLLRGVSAHTRKTPARGFNGAAARMPLCVKILPGGGGTRSFQSTSRPLAAPCCFIAPAVRAPRAASASGRRPARRAPHGA